jgi:hypothetical protein
MPVALRQFRGQDRASAQRTLDAKSPSECGRASAPPAQTWRMQRQPINPWSWSLKLRFDQAELIEGHQRQLVCSGQDAVDADDNPQHAGDMAAQIQLAVDGCADLGVRRPVTRSPVG